MRFLGLAEDSISRIRYVPALRGFSSARYALGNNSVDDFALSIDPAVNAGTLATTLSYEDVFREQIAETLAELTGVKLDRELIPGRQTTPVSLRQSPGRAMKRVVPTNEGFGTNQAVHLIAQTMKTPSSGAVLIEEPETHLHPLSQAKLGQWIAKHSVDEDKQFILATHSEYLLRGLLSQVRNEQIAPSDLMIYYFGLDENYQSQAKRLAVTTGGLIQGSFRDFFPEPDIPPLSEFFRGL